MDPSVVPPSDAALPSVADLGALVPASAPAPVTVTGVFVVTLLMAAMSGLGALPFFFVPRLSPRLASLANATACGVMLAASFDLIHEGEPHGPSLVVLGLLCGAVFIAFLQRFLRDFEDVEFAALRGADARKTALVVGIMTAHALGEGTGVGVSFGGVDGWAQGRLVALAIGVHNVPEGMAVATVLAAKGVSPRECALWAAVTSAPQALLAAPAFAFVETFAALLPFGLGFAAGCMAWITVAELLPDALEGADAATVATWATASAAALEAFRMLMNAAEARTADAAEAASLFSSSSSSSAPGGSAGVPLMGSSSDAGLNPSVAGPGVEQHPGLTLGATLRLAAASFVVPALLAAAAKLAARDYSKSDALGNGALPVTTHFSASANGNGGANGLSAVSKDERGASRGGSRGGSAVRSLLRNAQKRLGFYARLWSSAGAATLLGFAAGAGWAELGRAALSALFAAESEASVPRRAVASALGAFAGASATLLATERFFGEATEKTGGGGSGPSRGAAASRDEDAIPLMKGTGEGASGPGGGAYASSAAYLVAKGAGPPLARVAIVACALAAAAEGALNVEPSASTQAVVDAAGSRALVGAAFRIAPKALIVHATAVAAGRSLAEAASDAAWVSVARCASGVFAWVGGGGAGAAASAACASAGASAFAGAAVAGAAVRGAGGAAGRLDARKAREGVVRGAGVAIGALVVAWWGRGGW